ncbi:uncharacterized protein Z518_03294 [Rhinocladiella mackenziei CBS 650.93]|uniref:Rhinocladiella mackenziei CBS 650.93 unplaced genomic scaffold supercont1.2, whole genome shotgun sequence n=1 Tax=Rhinocladiella mackenziei CBS 650.93 TaxID=1442369 RepID=A0A0D2G292_9EURO|nr:uncharacterized protein Z518_03294 [Rhinocladiella mackenziei CBS 650.93]KIX08637.1 hypothetical protein Z518_03294 [Rhinocladiella mackenziei CBS 650.93]
MPESIPFTVSLAPGVYLVTSSSPQLSAIIDGIVHIHASCILHDGTLATFLPPLSHAALYSWWEDRLKEVTEGGRQLIVCLSEISNRTAVIEPQLEVSGVVSLNTPFSQTGPFRALVEKLFVSPLHRRRGIARRVMARLETVALRLDRWNLMLDTTVGTEAEEVYPRLGYQKLGVVSEYGYSPVDGRLVDEVWFWKDLRRMKVLQE